MGEAYTPGLQVREVTVLRKRRQLPIPGEVKVEEGSTVTPDTTVASTSLLGEIGIVDVTTSLGIPVGEMENIIKNGNLKVKVGDTVTKDEIIAERKYFFNLKQKICRSPMSGTVEHISTYSGNMHVRGSVIPVMVKAFIPGKVVEVMPKEGVVIETVATFIQGIFGVGGETHGELLIVAESPDEVLTEDKIVPSKHAGKILVGGSMVTGEALRKASEGDVRGIIVGGIEDKSLIDFLGYEIGVAITGHEEINTTLILTEGFGNIRMSDRTFNLLKKHEGKEASISGATQIRAGVIRPEIIIPLNPEKHYTSVDAVETARANRLQVGTNIRIIRGSDFGALGHVTSLQTKPQEILTESWTVVIEARLEDGRQITVPRTNVEIIQD